MSRVIDSSCFFPPHFVARFIFLPDEGKDEPPVVQTVTCWRSNQRPSLTANTLYQNTGEPFSYTLIICHLWLIKGPQFHALNQGFIKKKNIHRKSEWSQKWGGWIYLFNDPRGIGNMLLIKSVCSPLSLLSNMLIDSACVWQSISSITHCTRACARVCLLPVLSGCILAVFLSLGETAVKSSCLWFLHQNRWQTACEGLYNTLELAMCHDCTAAQIQAHELQHRRRIGVLTRFWPAIFDYLKKRGG